MPAHTVRPEHSEEGWIAWNKMLESKEDEFSSVQFSSVAQSCLTLCDSMNRSTPGLPVHHQLPEFTRTPYLCINIYIFWNHKKARNI